MTQYSNQFFRNRASVANRSAVETASLIVELFSPSTVLDLGCGTGSWLAAFAELGVQEIHGVDGEYVNEQELEIPRHVFQSWNLESNPYLPQRQFDLAMSLEVAEHLSQEAGDELVGSLTAAAPIVIFSAAVPGQGGTNHVNEQWPSYWAAKFREHGFTCYDVLRPRLWNNESVAWWYRQNMLVFIKSSACRTSISPLVESSEVASPNSLIHPLLYEQILTRLSFRSIASLRMLSFYRRYCPSSVRQIIRSAAHSSRKAPKEGCHA